MEAGKHRVLRRKERRIAELGRLVAEAREIRRDRIARLGGVYGQPKLPAAVHCCNTG